MLMRFVTRTLMLVVACGSALADAPRNRAGKTSAADPKNLILTYKQYASIRHDVPYVLEFRTGKGALLLYGVRHVFDPGDPQIADIQEEFKRFQPTVAYNEGGNPPTEKDLKSAVERYGEPGLVRFLGHQQRLSVLTFEPKREDEVHEMVKRYSAEQLKIFYVLRGSLTYRRSKRTDSLDTYMGRALRDPFWQKNGLGGPPGTIDELEASCAKLFGGFKDWRHVPEDWFDPTRSDHFTNEASNDSGWIRDRHIFTVLVDRAQTGDRVFAVIGASHVPVMEPALVSVLGQPMRKRNGKSETKQGSAGR
jgi:hypothetical protein